MMKKHMIISIVVFFVILSIFPAFIAAKPIPRRPPDEWVVASDYDITLGYYVSGEISDTYYNDGQYLVGKCVYLVYPFEPYFYNTFSITFDFSNEHYKQVKLEATVDFLGDGNFCVDAVYTSGSPRRVRLGCFSPGSTSHTFSVNHNRVLDEIILEYLETGHVGQRFIYIDQIMALWTWKP